jgi:hypothetical protein
MIAIDSEKMAPGLNQMVKYEATHHPGVACICPSDGNILNFL